MWLLVLSVLGCTSTTKGPTRYAPAGTGSSDAGSSDAGSSDAGSSDAGSSDAGSGDAGSGDAGSSDAGSSDAGSSSGGGELRGVWLTRYEWASTSTTASGLESTLADISDAGFNTVFLQVRGTFDATYDSALEPWSARLTGTLGQDPGWDPLAVAVTAGHALGLDVHAYINVAPLWLGDTAPASVGIAHAYQDHPDWVVADSSGTAMALNSSYVYASLGNPDVRARTAAVAADLADHYDIDGIHLDYVRFPGSDYSHDAASVAAYNHDTAVGMDLAGLSWEDWQREMVNDTVRGVSDAVDVPVTAAVWGIHTDEWGWGGVSQGFSDYYQDSRAFLSEQLIDANIPMAYWPVTDTEGERLDFRVLTRDHVAHAAGRHVYMGIGAYDIGYDATVRCVEVAREEGAQGVVIFSWSSISDYADDLAAGVFSTPAEPPDMPWR